MYIVMSACQLTMCCTLRRSHGCCVLVLEQDGVSPLYTASLNGHVDVMRALLAAGASVEQAKKAS